MSENDSGPFLDSEISWRMTEDDVFVNIRVPKERWHAAVEDFHDHGTEPFWFDELRRIQDYIAANKA